MASEASNSPFSAPLDTRLEADIVEASSSKAKKFANTSEATATGSTEDLRSPFEA